MMQGGYIFHNRYELIKRLGFGGYSEVWQAKDVHSDLIYALKIYNKQNEEGIKLCKDEFLKTHQLEHKHILKPTHFDVFDSRPYMVMPYMSGGTLQSNVSELDDVDIRNLINQIGGVLNYIHFKDNSIVHGDVKPDNILLNDKREFFLTDFGISKKLQNNLTQTFGGNIEEIDLKSGITPLAFRAPELVTYKNWTTQSISIKSDVWSFGMVLYYVKNKEFAFNGEGGLGQLMLMKGAGLSLVEAVNYERDNDLYDLRKLIHTCLALDSKDRPDYIQLSEIEETEIEKSVSAIKKNASQIPPSQDKTESIKKYVLYCLIAIFPIGFYFLGKYFKPKTKPIDETMNAMEILDSDTLTFSKIDSVGKLNSNLNEASIIKNEQVQKNDGKKLLNNKSTAFKNENSDYKPSSIQNASSSNLPSSNDNTISKNSFTENKVEPTIPPKLTDKPAVDNNPAKINKVADNVPPKTEESKASKSSSAKVTYNQVVKLKLKSDIKVEGLSKNDFVVLEVVDDVNSQGSTIITKGSSVNGIVKDVDKKKLTLEIPKLYSSGGTPIKTLLPKVFFKANDNGVFAEKGVVIEMKTNEFKDVLVK